MCSLLRKEFKQSLIFSLFCSCAFHRFFKGIIQIAFTYKSHNRNNNIFVGFTSVTILHLVHLYIDPMHDLCPGSFFCNLYVVFAYSVFVFVELCRRNHYALTWRIDSAFGTLASTVLKYGSELLMR